MSPADARYLRAVEEGDMSAARRMVDAARREMDLREAARIRAELGAIAASRFPADATWGGPEGEPVRVLGLASDFPPYPAAADPGERASGAFHLMVADADGKRTIRLAWDLYVGGRRMLVPHRKPPVRRHGPLQPFGRRVPDPAVERDPAGRVLALSERFPVESPPIGGTLFPAGRGAAPADGPVAPPPREPLS